MAAPVGLRQALDREQVIAPQRLGADHVARITGEADGHRPVRRLRECDAVEAIGDFGDDAIFQAELLDAQPQQPLQSFCRLEFRIRNGLMKPVQPCFAQPQAVFVGAPLFCRRPSLGDVTAHGEKPHDLRAAGIGHGADRDRPAFQRAFEGRADGFESGYLAARRRRHGSRDVALGLRRPPGQPLLAAQWPDIVGFHGAKAGGVHVQHPPVEVKLHDAIRDRVHQAAVDFFPGTQRRVVFCQSIRQLHCRFIRSVRR